MPAPVRASTNSPVPACVGGDGPRVGEARVSARFRAGVDLRAHIEFDSVRLAEGEVDRSRCAMRRDLRRRDVLARLNMEPTFGPFGMQHAQLVSVTQTAFPVLLAALLVLRREMLAC
jgi:hypothetical protein